MSKPPEMPKQPGICIYHAGCPDGFAAAWAVWKALGRDYPFEYHPAAYGTDPPEVAGREVLVVDFCYPREVLLAMKGEAAGLRVFDHHKTAAEDLDGLEFVTFDMERSGAGITWDEMHIAPRPWIIDYVEDRDLWRFELEGSKEIAACIKSETRTFEAWSQLELTGAHAAACTGQAILKGIATYVNAVKTNAHTATISGQELLLVNAPMENVSELLHDLNQESSTGVSAAWWRRGDGIYQVSLRSSDASEVDVSAIAKAHGGGGHVHAAGFQADRPWWLGVSL